MRESLAGADPNTLSDRQKLAWLRLIRSENVGPATFHRLVAHAGSAEAALEMLPELSRRGGRAKIRIASADDALSEWERIERFGARLVAFGEADYPPHLSHIDGPPPLLSAKGGQEILSRTKMLAIVGARNASMSGVKIAGEIAEGLSAAGFGIVSGLARGIDGAAHRASLQGGTVAVLAGGVDILYPPEHGGLLADILAKGGAVVSEMPFAWKPRARDFPRRNRLISGLALGVILVEAARASGSLHTARFAVEQNREVFAVPGSPLDPRSEGGNRLIREGAILVGNSAEVLDSLGEMKPPRLPFHEMREDGGRETSPITYIDDSERGLILSALGQTPVDPNELARFTGLPARMVNVVLLELELAGRLERHGGGKISLIDGRI